MDFDDHDDQEEEIGIPVGSSYESPPGNSSRGGPSGGALGKIGGGGGEGAAASAAMLAGSGGSWKASGGGGGGRYRECLKNHAVSIGGHAVDGCGEFMAAGEEGTLDALKCAACNCHRNFHRKETEGGGGAGGVGGIMGMEGPGGFHHHFSPYYRIPAGYLHHHHTASHIRPSPLPLALPSTSGGGGAHSRDDQEDMSNPMIAGSGGGAASSGGREGKKRFRTKFTQEQKDKMLALAEKLGWRIQKHDEAAVQQFCAETNVKRHVLKVWMHNNKHTLGKKP